MTDEVWRCPDKGSKELGGGTSPGLYERFFGVSLEAYLSTHLDCCIAWASFYCSVCRRIRPHTSGVGVGQLSVSTQLRLGIAGMELVE